MTTPAIQRLAAGWRWVEVRRDDTLQTIAWRELGDAARWAELASLNDLLPPYLTGDAALAASSGGRVILYGSKVRVFASTDEADADAEPDEVYGADVALDAQGFLRASAGDLATVTGLSNLAAALTRRIITEHGELLFHASYGSRVRDALGRKNTPARAALAARSARLALVQDSRVHSVGEVRANVTGDALALDIKVQPITSGPAMSLRVEV